MRIILDDAAKYSAADSPIVATSVGTKPPLKHVGQGFL